MSLNWWMKRSYLSMEDHCLLWSKFVKQLFATLVIILNPIVPLYWFWSFLISSYFYSSINQICFFSSQGHEMLRPAQKLKAATHISSSSVHRFIAGHTETVPPSETCV